MIHLRPFIFFALCTIFSNFHSTAKEAHPESSQKEKPNIVFVLADDLGYSDIGAYGATKIETPHLNSLAENGLRMTQMHNTSKSFPSRDCLLTGTYAQQSDMHQSPGDFHNAVMFGEVLKHADYRTLFIGKHHSTDNPYHWGFDHYRGLRDGASNYFNPGKQRKGEGKPAQKSWVREKGGRVFCFDDTVKQPFTPDKDYYATDTWTDWAINLLDAYKNENKPFSLYLAYTAPHDPLQAPKEIIQKYEGKFDEGYEAIAKARYKKQRRMGLLDDRYPRSEPKHQKWENLSDSAKQDQARRMEVYAAMIDRMDQNIGRVIDKIKAMEEWENTVFMFASDNGASAEVVKIGDGPIGTMTRWASLKEDWANVANTPFRYYKNYSYQGGICTPFIVHWPGVTQKGFINHTQAQFIDILPTFMDIAGTDWYPDTYKDEQVPKPEGKSLVPVFKGNRLNREEPLYFDWSNGSALINEDYKIVRLKDNWHLYDMHTDRTETNNIKAEKPETFKKLKKKWIKWAREVGISEEKINNVKSD